MGIVSDRLKLFINNNPKFSSIRKFEEMIGWKNSSVNQFIDNPKSDRLDELSKFVPELNLDWLLKGYGMMYRNIQMTNEEFISHRPEPTDKINRTSKDVLNALSEIQKNKSYNGENLNNEDSLLRQGIGVTDKSKPIDTVTPVPTEHYMWVEYADLSAAAGELGGNNIDTLPETKKRLVPREYENGEYLVIRVDGSSMDDGSKYSIPDGTEILIKKYYLNPGEKLPIRNNLFVVNAREGKALKQITEHNTEQNYICCHSYNPEFKDYKIDLEDILEIFIYRKVVSSRPPIPDIN